MKHRKSILHGIVAGALGVVSVLAACYDYTIITTLDPLPAVACQGGRPGDPCVMRYFNPSLRSCNSGTAETGQTCTHTKTENITWYEYHGQCGSDPLVCLVSQQYGPYTIYNFDQWEAVDDPTHCP